MDGHRVARAQVAPVVRGRGPATGALTLAVSLKVSLVLVITSSDLMTNYLNEEEDMVIGVTTAFLGVTTALLRNNNNRDTDNECRANLAHEKYHDKKIECMMKWRLWLEECYSRKGCQEFRKFERRNKLLEGKKRKLNQKNVELRRKEEENPV
ncbi:hypothetical protein Cgig2_021642 [Carnegiea gigantea]|uniref:Uncharacterized protein n=1 Tax=Carnegiea gigantea TaxID=171969 RepID=A0A9Q1K3B6_9CARY|nr:hypothetical protein Cgig2_021642 [Carnegiea gigantea]